MRLLLVVYYFHRGESNRSAFLKSKILNSDRKYAIYLPSDYDYSNREYPVLYLLHGSGDDHTGWVQFGEVKSIGGQKPIGRVFLPQ